MEKYTTMVLGILTMPHSGILNLKKVNIFTLTIVPVRGEAQVQNSSTTGTITQALIAVTTKKPNVLVEKTMRMQ